VFCLEQFSHHPGDGDAGALPLGDDLVLLNQTCLPRLNGEHRAFELAHYSYRVETDRRHVEAKILLRLTDLDRNEAVLTELAAAPDRRVGSFDGLDRHYDAPLDHDALPDAEPSDLLGRLEAEANVLPFLDRRPAPR